MHIEPFFDADTATVTYVVSDISEYASGKIGDARK
jgi:hypothetical protein